MLNYPYSVNDIETLYKMVELDNTSGYYPVGKNNKWHSGIHFETKSPIKVIQRGNIIAYRISKDFQKKQRTNIIGEESFLKLSKLEQSFYEKEEHIYGSKTLYTYKLKSSLSEKDKNYLYSNSFVLIKSQIESSDLQESIPIYSLYMNLLPDNENLLSKVNEYQKISRLYSNLKPFYRGWKFKIDNQYVPTEILHKLNNKNAVYSGSTFISNYKRVVKLSNIQNITDIYCCKMKYTNSITSLPLKACKINSITFKIKNEESRRIYKTGNTDSVGFCSENKTITVTGEDCNKIINYKKGDCYIPLLIGSNDVTGFIPKKCWIAKSSMTNPDYYKCVYNTKWPYIYSLQKTPQGGDRPFVLNETNTLVKMSAYNYPKYFNASEYDAFISRSMPKDNNMSSYVPVETYLQETPKLKRINLKDAEIEITEIKGEVEYNQNNKSLFTDENGIIKYFQHKDSEEGEPIGLLSLNDEFTIENGENDVIENKSISQLIITLNSTKYKIKLFDLPEKIFLVKSIVDSSKLDSIQICDIPVTEEDCIGFPGTDKKNVKRFFDFALILEKSLFEYKQKDSNEKKYLLDIPEDIQFYIKENIQNTSIKQYFPYLTSYKVLQTDSFGDESARKIQITKVPIWFRNIDIEKNNNEGTCKIINPISGFWLVSTYGNYTRDKETALNNKWFTEQLFTIRDEMVEKPLKYTMISKNTNETQIELDLTQYSKELIMWVKDVNYFSKDEGQMIDSREIIFYSENPICKTVKEVSKPTNLEKITKIDEESLDFYNQSGLCKLVGSDYYIKKEDVQKCQHEAFDWQYFFTEITEDASEQQEKGTEADIFCNRSEVISQIDVDNEQNDIPGWQYRVKDNQITQEELEQVYQDNEISNKIRANLRKIVCKHPLEWNKKLYDNIKDDYEKATGCQLQNEQELKDEAEATDIWEGLKPLHDIADSNECLWFVHPLYFYNHMDRTGAFGFNPYLGMTIHPRFAEGADPDIEVTSNPGFAPAVKDNSQAWIKERFPDFLKKRLNNSDLCWATVNYDFDTTEAYGGYHSGMDFAGIEGTEIYALVEGVVWATTFSKTVVNQPKTGSYGRCMIIKGNNDRLYLLGHLSKFRKEVGQKVYIGDVVAEVGNTGNSFGAHLHIEVLECSINIKDKVLKPSSNKKHVIDGGDGSVENDGLTWSDTFGRKRFHPLKQN